MFGKLKNWLGIEGLKMEIDMPIEIDSGAGHLKGNLIMFARREQHVRRIHLVFKEKYSRGRRSNKLINEYILGEQSLNTAIIIEPDQIYELEFSLPYDVLKSEMDNFGDWNIITRQMVNVAKKIKDAKSIYWIEVTAEVDGAALNPYTKKILLPQ